MKNKLLIFSFLVILGIPSIVKADTTSFYGSQGQYLGEARTGGIQVIPQSDFGSDCGRAFGEGLSQSIIQSMELRRIKEAHNSKVIKNYKLQRNQLDFISNRRFRELGEKIATQNKAPLRNVYELMLLMDPTKNAALLKDKIDSMKLSRRSQKKMMVFVYEYYGCRDLLIQNLNAELL